MANEQKRIDELVDKLGCSIAEAKGIIASDKIIDKGGRTPFDLPPEQEKLAKKWGNAGTRKQPTIYKFDKKNNKKANPTKEGLIALIAETLKNSDLKIENLEIPNLGKLITFDLDGKSFEIDLKQKRAPKK